MMMMMTITRDARGRLIDNGSTDPTGLSSRADDCVARVGLIIVNDVRYVVIVVRRAIVR